MNDKAVESYIHEYVKSNHPEKYSAFVELFNFIKKHIPKGFEACIAYNMVVFVVPHAIYPKGYHCDSKQPLPFLSIAAQKKFIGIYHMGMYADKDLYNWFVAEYPKYCKSKIDIGKSCLRIKKMNEIPYPLIQELLQKISVQDWIALYEKSFTR